MGTSQEWGGERRGGRRSRQRQPERDIFLQQDQPRAAGAGRERLRQSNFTVPPPEPWKCDLCHCRRPEGHFGQLLILKGIHSQTSEVISK